MEILDANDLLEVEEDDTDYSVVPLYLAEVSDLYQVELGNREAKGGSVLPLVVLAREMRGTSEWNVPDKKTFLDLIAHLHSVTVRDAPLNHTLEWNNFWEGVGLIGVHTKNRGLLQQLRTLITTVTNGRYEFCTVPKVIFEPRSTARTSWRDN